jgi:hypothetical protein
MIFLINGTQGHSCCKILLEPSSHCAGNNDHFDFKISLAHKNSEVMECASPFHNLA